MQVLEFASLAVVTALPASHRAPEDLEPGVERRVTEAARSLVDGGRLRALSVAIALGRELVYEGAWGRVGADGAPAEPESAFRADALLPQLVTAAVLRRAEGGGLALDSTVGEWLEELRESEVGSVRVDQLLAHTSGVVSLEELLPGEDAGDASRGAVLERLKTRSLVTEPGECIEHSVVNVALAAWVLEREAELPLPEVLEAEVFEPLELRDLSFVERAGGAGWTSLLSPLELRAPAAELVSLQLGLVDGAFLRSSRYGRPVDPDVWSGGAGRTSSILTIAVPRADVGPFDGVSYGGVVAGSAARVAHYPGAELALALVADGEGASLRELERRLARAVLNLPEPEISDLSLEPEERKRYSGTYFSGCTQYVVVEAGDHIALEEPERRMPLLYQGGHLFVAQGAPEIRVFFEVEDDLARAFQLEEEGTVVRAARLQ